MKATWPSVLLATWMEQDICFLSSTGQIANNKLAMLIEQEYWVFFRRINITCLTYMGIWVRVARHWEALEKKSFCFPWNWKWKWSGDEKKMVCLCEWVLMCTYMFSETWGDPRISKWWGNKEGNGIVIFRFELHGVHDTTTLSICHCTRGNYCYCLFILTKLIKKKLVKN